MTEVRVFSKLGTKAVTDPFVSVDGRTPLCGSIPFRV